MWNLKEAVIDKSIERDFMKEITFTECLNASRFSPAELGGDLILDGNSAIY